jgi:hypothetical protein
VTDHRGVEVHPRHDGVLVEGVDGDDLELH